LLGAWRGARSARPRSQRFARARSACRPSARLFALSGTAADESGDLGRDCGARGARRLVYSCGYALQALHVVRHVAARHCESWARRWPRLGAGDVGRQQQAGANDDGAATGGFRTVYVAERAQDYYRGMKMPLMQPWCAVWKLRSRTGSLCINSNGILQLSHDIFGPNERYGLEPWPLLTERASSHRTPAGCHIDPSPQLH
jgi:hypothetical protein